MKTTSLLAQLIPIILNSAPVENSKSDLDKVINFLLGKYTISEHLMTGRLPAELLYYQGKLILPDEWWAKNRLTIGLTAGAGWIYLNEYYEFFIEPYKREYSTFLEVILKDPDTRYDMGLATFNLILFAVEKLIPTFDGVILIETHSPYLLNNWLNPLRTCGLREEVVISSKYLSFRKFLLGIALGHGEAVNENDELANTVPSPFSRVFGPRKLGFGFSPGGPPENGSYCGVSIQYEDQIWKIPVGLYGVIYTSVKKDIAFKIGASGLVRY